MKRNLKCLGLILATVGIIAIPTYLKFSTVKQVVEVSGEEIPVADTSAEDDVNKSQDQESALILGKFSYVEVNSNPRDNAALLAPALRREIKNQSLTEKDLQAACLQIGLILANENGMPREDFEKYVSHLKKVTPVVFIDERAKMSVDDQFSSSYAKRLSENSKLTGICLESGKIIVYYGFNTVGDDIASQVGDIPGFFTAASITLQAWIFHRDPSINAVSEKNISVPSIFVSFPVKNADGNVYPLCITLQKNPTNNNWLVNRANRTVNVAVYSKQPIIY